MHPYVLTGLGIAVVAGTLAAGGLAFLALAVACQAMKQAGKGLKHQAALMAGLDGENEASFEIQQKTLECLREQAQTQQAILKRVMKLEARQADGPWSVVG